MAGRFFGNVVGTIAGAGATIGTGIAAGVTFGQVNAVNKACVDSAKLMGDSAGDLVTQPVEAIEELNKLLIGAIVL